MTIKNTILISCLVVLFTSCGITKVADICNETPSTTYLVSVRNVNYSEVGSNFLNNPVNHDFDICNEHFPANTTAGHEFILATNEVSDVLGCELNFTRRWTGNPHKTAFELFPSNATSSIFDYVDVNAPMPNNCSLPGDLTFAMRTCRFDKSNGGTDHFTIMAKSTNYDHFSDSSSKDHPYKHGILHELAHGFGMNHTPSWDSADKKYISTMQGNLEYLSALDVAYLRHKYPESMTNHRNYVASSLTRFDETKGKFEKQNPSSFYIDADGNLKDCKTNAAPEFFVAWFNTGNSDGESTLCGTNSIFLREKSVSADTIEIKTWKVATMPYLSQDQWKGTVNLTLSNPSNIDFDRDWELVFKVNAWGVLDETTDADNEITMDVTLKNGSCR